MKKILSAMTLVALLAGCEDPKHLVADIDEYRYEEAMVLKEDLRENRHLYPEEEIVKIEEQIEGLLKNNEYR